MATPLTVLASPVNLPNNSQCFAELDVTADTLSVPLNHHSIDISINDSNGNDPNRINNIIVTVATTPDFGKILQSPNNTAVVSFQGDKLLSDAIFYHFSNRTAITSTDTFSLEFRYGHASYFWSDFVHGMHPSHSTSNKEYISAWLEVALQ